MKNPDLTREFTKESFARTIDSCNDISELRDFCKRSFNLYLNERDYSRCSLNSLKDIRKDEFMNGILLDLH